MLSLRSCHVRLTGINPAELINARGSGHMAMWQLPPYCVRVVWRFTPVPTGRRPLIGLHSRTCKDSLRAHIVQFRPMGAFTHLQRSDNPPHSLSDDSTNMLPTNLGGDIDHLHVLDLSRRVLTLARLRFLLTLHAGICLGLLLGERSARET